jgi:hemerythrin superfamily protein
MSFIDKIVSAVTPPESEQDRVTARQHAQSLARPGTWLAIVLDHHVQIESAFSQALSETSADARLAAFKQLQIVLTGHANAEETVLYPALGDIGEKTHTAMAYEEQAMAKIQLGKIEHLDPMSSDWQEKLEHVQGAVLHHMYEEERTWFVQLQSGLPESRSEKLTERFVEEFSRYTGEPMPGQPDQLGRIG